MLSCANGAVETDVVNVESACRAIDMFFGSLCNRKHWKQAVVGTRVGICQAGPTGGPGSVRVCVVRMVTLM